MINGIGAVYVENKIELSWSIRMGAVYDENEKGQQRDQLYRCCLQWRQNWIAMTDSTGCALWFRLDMTMK